MKCTIQNKKTWLLCEITRHGCYVYYDFDDKHIISTGPREATVINKKIEWDYYSRQGVHLLKRPIKMSKEESELTTNCSIKVEASIFL
jgi:hypothetical protein